MNQLHNLALQRKQLKELVLSMLTDDKKLEFLEWYDTKMKRKYGGNWNTDFTLLLKIVDWEDMIDSDVFLEWLEGSE